MNEAREKVLGALAGVMSPVLKRPLTDAGLIKEVTVEGTTVSLRVVELGQDEEARASVEKEIRAALAGAGFEDAKVAWETRVYGRDIGPDDPVPEVKNIVLVMSGKGGVGKSTVASNLTMALRRAGWPVGLLDADIYGPSVPTMFGIMGKPMSKDGVKIEPLERFGVKLMSIGFLLEDPKAAVIWRGPMLHGALTQFLKDVAWGKLDYLVIDLPPGTGDVALTLSQRAKVTGAVMVTTPQEVALQDVYKAVSMCERLGIPVLGVVENMSYFVDTAGVRHELFGAGGGARVAEMANAPLLGQIPIDPTVRECGDEGTPVVQAKPASPIAQSFAAVANELTSVIASRYFQEAGGAAPTERKRLKIVR
ncbi:MAG: Mrp/NBP35 family ATP-binding protein [Deltaproteobacteria bacterium]|nr:Mrp/NBP35 family ATP-binding protein [Deltaproteobacteria bacterium]